MCAACASAPSTPYPHPILHPPTHPLPTGHPAAPGDLPRGRGWHARCRRYPDGARWHDQPRRRGGPRLGQALRVRPGQARGAGGVGWLVTGWGWGCCLQGLGFGGFDWLVPYILPTKSTVHSLPLPAITCRWTTPPRPRCSRSRPCARATGCPSTAPPARCCWASRPSRRPR